MRSGHYNWQRRAQFFRQVEADREAMRCLMAGIGTDDDSDSPEETEAAYRAATAEAVQMVRDGVWQ